MNRPIKLFIRTLLILLALIFAVQPYNWICQITGACNPFYFSYYIPKKEGDELKVKFEVTNYNQNIIFVALETESIIRTNSKKTATYHVKNLSKKTIKIRPTLFIEPEFAKKYITRYQCLCSQSYKIKGGEEFDLKMEFEVSNFIEDNFEFMRDKSIIIRYKIDQEKGFF